MTLPVAAEIPARVSWRRKLAGRCVCGAARLLVRLPPDRLCRVLKLASAGARPATREAALRARETVVAASARCAGQGCLQRSVAVALLCRLHGRWPDWCSGVRTRPFQAHAWVEAEGAPVGERDDVVLFHTTVSVRHRTAARGGRR